MAQFFIDRPKFAWVFALLVLLMGLLSIQQLSISSYPNIAPPQVNVTASYPGASAKTIEDSVTTVIENQMNGIEGLRYMASESTRAGQSNITLTFETGTDLNIAGVEVQNRLKRVESSLPASVVQQGVNIDKTRPDFLMILALFSPNGTFSETDLADYIDANLLNEIRRIDGIGTAEIFGAKYAMRVWLDPQKMSSFAVTPTEVIAAIRAQNAQLASGELGSLPSPESQQLNATVIVPSRLNTVEEFGNIVLRSNSEGALVRLKDVAEVERGSENYSSRVLLNGKSAAAFSTKLNNNGNALEAANAVKAKMDEMAQFFPEDMEWMSPYDTSLFVDVAITEVFHTLIEAVILVTLVMFIFLQNWRSTIIPLIVVPFSLVGSAIFMYMLGFSINMLTLFGMVLAIGIVVDDAILVVENIERLMEEEGLTPYMATKKSMRQISGAIIGTTVVLVSVFIPMAFMGGSVGEIYKQFSLTIVSSVVFSAIFALSLTPAMGQGLLKNKLHAPVSTSPSAFSKIFSTIMVPFKKFGDAFNVFFDKVTNVYMTIVKYTLTKKGLMIIIGAYVIVTSYDFYQLSSLPKGFVPSEDQGFMVAGSIMPSGATQSRTKSLTDKTDKWLSEQPEVKDVITVLGFGFAGTGQNTSITFANLVDWEERSAQGMRDADAIVADANNAFFPMMDDGLLFAFNMPAIPGLGNDNGFDLRLKNRSTNTDPSFLDNAAGQLLGQAAQNDLLVGVRPNSLAPAPQLQINIDRIKARALDIDTELLNSTIQVALGSAYVNDYIDNGNVRSVWVQANQQTRANVNEIMNIELRNNNGELVKLNEVASYEWIQGAAKLTRYNGVPSLPISGAPAPGVSSGKALNAMEDIVATLPDGIDFEWSGQSLEEKISGGQAPIVFALSLLIVFLVLSALYESWSIPLAVMLVVPLGILGVVLFVSLRDLPNDVYFTVGLITIIGLSTKNAIVIVEFALDAQREGAKLYDAVLDACRLRFRPILMTSFAFILGVLPLVTSTGAGSASRRAIGTAVFGGMITATLLGIFFTPVFYYIIRTLIPAKPTKASLEAENV